MLLRVVFHADWGWEFWLFGVVWGGGAGLLVLTANHCAAPVLSGQEAGRDLGMADFRRKRLRCAGEICDPKSESGLVNRVTPHVLQNPGLGRRSPLDDL